MTATSDNTRPVIVTARKPRPRKAPMAVAEASASHWPGGHLSPEEVRQHGDADDDLIRELVRRATGTADGYSVR
jgi:hypothetical protein